MLPSNTFLGFIAAAAAVVVAAPVSNERAVSTRIIGNEDILGGSNEELIHKKEPRARIYAGMIGNEVIVEGFNENHRWI